LGTVKPASRIMRANSSCGGKRSMDSTKYCRTGNETEPDSVLSWPFKLTWYESRSPATM
jgi:hypothetical protein